MSNEFRKIDSELTQAMMNGEVLENYVGCICRYDPDHEFGPFVYTTSDGEDKKMMHGWYLEWRIKRSPKIRPMNYREKLGVLAQSGCVVRWADDNTWELPSNNFLNPILSADLGQEWAIIDEDGEITYGPHKFEVEID
jgi:hypothetical protein